MTEKNKIETGFASDAQKNPQRVVFVTRNTSAKVTDDRGPQLMTYPHLLLREAIALQVLAVVLVLAALFWDAPLEQLANPLLTPNPAKAPGISWACRSCCTISRRSSPGSSSRRWWSWR